MDFSRVIELSAVLVSGAGLGQFFRYLATRTKSRAAVLIDENDKEITREQALWKQVGMLQEQINELRKQMDAMQRQHDSEVERIHADWKSEVELVRNQKHDAQSQAQGLLLQNVLLKAEVNSLLKELERPEKYPVSPQMVIAEVQQAKSI